MKKKSNQGSMNFNTPPPMFYPPPQGFMPMKNPPPPGYPGPMIQGAPMGANMIPQTKYNMAPQMGKPIDNIPPNQQPPPPPKKFM